MYINQVRPRELRRPSKAKRQNTNSNGEKEFTEELEAIVDSVSIESIDTEKNRDEPKKKQSPAVPNNDSNSLSITA